MNSEICRINGPVVKAKNATGLKMHETVYVGYYKLIGEVIGLEEDIATIQVYEMTTGLKVGEPVIGTGKPLSVQLAPGIIGNVFDGIERPLFELERRSGSFIERGVNIQQLDPHKKWHVKMLIKPGDVVYRGMIFAEVKETPQVTHKVMLPPVLEKDDAAIFYNQVDKAEAVGTVIEVVPDGSYTINEVLARVAIGKFPRRSISGEQRIAGELNGGEPIAGISTELKEAGINILELKMLQEWPVRKPRPYKNRLFINEPLITGQRIIDTFFPIGKGGAAAIPGGFGTGKTMTQHQIAKWADADIIVYIGCGERGNEMTEVLEDFPKLIDPKTERSLMERTILIANTSDMPVAAREASIYTGITLAEYYRDMGYNVAVMADSTSRWAEALREISGRLEEMPAEEGFPAYLPSRLSEFYERAGKVENLNKTIGSISIIGAVSPQGGDFSEPVTQNTRRYIRCFWGLDRQLAYARHYPAINWLTSYSEYVTQLDDWYVKNVNSEFLSYRAQLIKILEEEGRLTEIVKLIGSDILADDQKLTLEIGRVIRLGFLQQAAFHQIDTYVPLQKQFLMMEIILLLYNRASELIKKGVPISQIRESGLFNEIIDIKYKIKNDELDRFDDVKKKINEFFDKHTVQ